MADLREMILARLAVVIAGIDGIESSARNLDQQSETRLPAITLFDGDEEATENLRSVSEKPNTVALLPIIEINLGDVPENVGTVANEWRAKLLKAVLLDSTTKALCDGVVHGGVRYLAMQSSLAPGRMTQLALTFHFSILYPFRPTLL